MQHIEDLKNDKFIELILNLNKAKISIKLDGVASFLIGYDEKGLYTSFGRHLSKINKMYSEEEWLNRRNIFINPAVSAHNFVKQYEEIIVEYIKPGETVYCELLFGRIPNCIEYDINKNNLVILTNDKLSDALFRKSSISNVRNYILSNKTLRLKSVEHTWKFGRNQSSWRRRFIACPRDFPTRKSSA